MKPYKCERCDKAFTQRCSLESHSKKVHGLEYVFDYKERRAKVYVCEECGHSTSDPEDHFRHLQQNHPFCPALARCHDKRQFKFRTESTENASNAVPKRIVNENDSHDFSESVSSVDSNEDCDQLTIKIPVSDVDPGAVSEAIASTDIRYPNDKSKDSDRMNVDAVLQRSEGETGSASELSIAVKSVQSEFDKMGKQNSGLIAIDPNRKTDKETISSGSIEELYSSKGITYREKIRSYSPQKFPWKSPRKSPKKITRSPQKLKVQKPTMKSSLALIRGEPFKIYQDVPQYDIENRSIQKLRQYGGDDYYKSRKAGMSESSVEREARNGENRSDNIRVKQFGSQDNRAMGLKQPLGSLTQNTQYLKRI